MPFEYELVADFMIEPPPFRPEIKGWNRLEGRPRNADFERALRAEARDALWFLSRQWQFGELQGEDAGSPIEARLVTSRRSLYRYRPNGGFAVPYDPATPLEAMVERETPPFDLVTHRQVNQALLRLIGTLPDLDAIKTGLILAYPLSESDIDGYLDMDGRRALVLAQRYLANARSLLTAIGDASFDTAVDGFAGVSSTSGGVVKAAGSRLAAWYAALYDLPSAPATNAWVPERLEYRFDCTIATPDGPETVLSADGYDGGALDWWSFDIAAAVPDLGPETTPRPPETREVLSFVPVPVSFSGMPSPRFWEMEDRKVEFANIDSSTTDIAKILLTEFALLFANDWCLVPCETSVGSLTKVAGLVVTDVFGERLLIRAAGRGTDEAWQSWRLFVLSTQAASDIVESELFLPPVMPKQMAGLTLEKVVFLRDEMANMAWAVEATVPSALGRGVDGYGTARDTQLSLPLPPPLAEGVDVRYELGTDVPWNWRPFLPVHVPSSTRAIRLRRSRMPGPDRPIRGRVLAVPGPYDVFEEEVPRAGAQVSVGFQRTRWAGGTIHLWFGRRAARGRGEGSSGLVFDQVREQGAERHVR